MIEKIASSLVLEQSFKHSHWSTEESHFSVWSILQVICSRITFVQHSVRCSFFLLLASNSLIIISNTLLSASPIPGHLILMATFCGFSPSSNYRWEVVSGCCLALLRCLLVRMQVEKDLSSLGGNGHEEFHHTPESIYMNEWKQFMLGQCWSMHG